MQRARRVAAKKVDNGPSVAQAGKDLIREASEDKSRSDQGGPGCQLSGAGARPMRKTCQRTKVSCLIPANKNTVETRIITSSFPIILN
eukprot:6285204-Amphidinium_carterae.1